VGAVRAAASAGAGGVPADRLTLRSPVTTPCRVVAQAVNYRSHAQDTGAGEDPPPVFFRKSSASVSGPTDDVVRPRHVRLLDYELEVGLVMGHQLSIGAAVTDADLPSYLAGLVMCNDVSARDVQLEKGQFYESKSYPTKLRGSVPLSDQGDAGAVAVGTNVLEFHPAVDDRVPEGRELLPVERLEEGQRYFVYVTNASGLYRYDMNDIVEVAGYYGKTPLIRFIQKGKAVVSFTGEKLYETQVIAAVDQAFAALRGRYHFIAAVAELVDGTSPRLVFLTEFDQPVTDPDGAALVDQVDAALGDQNSEYQTKRKSLRYGAPIIGVVRPGEFDRYRRRMVEQGHRTDGQFKVLRLTSDTTFGAEFEAERDLVGGAAPKLVPEQVPPPRE
jgi:GH3 auxin-responsive promoter/Fumarylacetoacetate (FAA) hydrolase family